MIKPVGRSESADDIILCAVNTGHFYPSHCSLARRNATLREWIMHVQSHVYPMYDRDVLRGENKLIRDTETIATVAQGLRDYYVAHIAEG